MHVTTWREGVELLRRGHEALGAPTVDATPQLMDTAASVAAGSTAVWGGDRAHRAAQRLYEAACRDEELMRLLRRVAASHREAHHATGRVLGAARADGGHVDTPMAQREMRARMVGYLREQHAHVMRSHAQARAYLRELRMIRYRRAVLRHRRHEHRSGTGHSDGVRTTLTAGSSQRAVAAAIIAQARSRGYSPQQSIAILSAGLQESGLRSDAVGGGGAWVGIFQQDTSYPGRWDPNRNITEFFDRLDAKGGAGSPDIWKTIFWLQQRPGEPSAGAAYAHGRRAYLGEIQSQLSVARRLYRNVTSAV